MIIYKTKAGLLIKVLFITVIVILLAVSLVEKNIALFFVTAGIALFVIYLFYATHYTVYEQVLTIKSGFLFKASLNIDSIKRITRQRRHLLTGPGFSSDRLMIEYSAHDCVIIAPQLTETFIRHLQKINPSIEYREH